MVQFMQNKRLSSYIVSLNYPYEMKHKWLKIHVRQTAIKRLGDDIRQRNGD